MAFFLLFSAIKILNVAQFESDESGDGYDCVGLVDLSETGELVVEIGLNCDQTHLVALTCSIISENEEKNFIRVYDLRTLNFAASNNNSDQYQVKLSSQARSKFARIRRGWLLRTLAAGAFPSWSVFVSYPKKGLLDFSK